MYCPLQPIEKGNSLLAQQKKSTAGKGSTAPKKKNTTTQKKSGTKGTGSKSTKATPKKTAAEKKREQELAIQEATVQERIKNEVLGVILIALGVLFALYLYFIPDNPFGKVFHTVAYAATGLVALGLPPVFLIMGVMTIAGRKRSPIAGRTAVAFIAIVFASALVHLLCKVPYQGEEGKTIPLVDYILQCYDRATGAMKGYARGGGILGGLLCYLLQCIGGQSLAGVVVVCGLLICLLIMTRISLKTFPELLKINIDSIFEAIDPDDEEEYTAAEEVEILKARAKKPMYIGRIEGEEGNPEDVGHLENIPAAGEHKVQEEEKPKKSRKKHEPVPFDEAFYVPEAEPPVDKGEDTLSYFPLEGKLNKRKSAEPVMEDEDEPIDDVLPLRATKPLKEAEFPTEPTEPTLRHPLPARRARKLVDAPVEEETDSTESPFVPNEPLIPMDPVPVEYVDERGEEKAPERSHLTFEELQKGFASRPYEKGEQAPNPNAPKPDKEFVYHDEVTGEALQKAQEVPEGYVAPPIDLLDKPRQTFGKSTENPQQTGELLVETLHDFNIETTLLNISVGPVVTRFELQPAKGVRVNRITSLSNDIALALAASRVRIEAPIPGKAAVGVEVPNKSAATVLLRDIVDSKEFAAMTSPTSMALGKDIGGKIVVADLAKMPHMLIAGSTGSGKSVCINDLILSMVYKSSPADLRLILVDPKQVELSVYAKLPHLLIPVVTDPKKAAGALRWAVNEMTLRYKKFSDLGTRDLVRYNEQQEEEKNRLPRIVVIIDELADLMMVAPDEVEDSICRVAQLGRAAGIHLIVATQRPSADVITGLIKANIPSRAAFAVSSAIDSRIILDATGAEKLLGRGDCLFHPNGAAKPTRLQAAFVSDEEVQRVMDFFEKQSGGEPQFDKQIMDDMTASGGAKGGVFGEGKQEDELLGEAVRIVVDSGQASISMIQRKLRVGYARAARLVDMMEEHGYVSGFDGSKPRKVLIKRAQFEALFGDGEGIDAGSYDVPAAPAEPAPAPAPAPTVTAETPEEDSDVPWDI